MSYASKTKVSVDQSRKKPSLTYRPKSQRFCGPQERGTEMTDTHGGYLVTANKPSIWNRLGFNFRFDEDLFDWRNQDPPEEGFVIGAFETTTHVHVGWLDRIKLLVTGHCAVTTWTKTDVLINRAETRSEFAVLPPSKRKG